MLIRGGTGVDPGQGLHARRDVRLDAERIVPILNIGATGMVSPAV